MDGLGFNPIGWGVNTAAAGAAAAVTAAASVGNWLMGGLDDLLDLGAGLFPAQDLIDWSQPPNPAEPSEFKPSPGYAPPSSVGPKPMTLEEYFAELAEQEAVQGVQTPLGPDDPNQYTPILPGPRPEDPQAPLTNDFVPSPQPWQPGGLGQNTLIDFNANQKVNPGAFDGYALKPKFRGISGTGYRGTFTRVVASAVPEMVGDVVAWKARVQAFLGGTVVRTWNFDAGSTPPSSGDFQFIFDQEIFGVALDLLDPANQFGIEQTRYYSLSQPAVPSQPAPQPIDEGAAAPPTGPVWGGGAVPDGFVPVVDNGEGDVEQPIVPPYPLPPTPQPVMPVAPVPTLPNNPTSVPAVGTNGQVLKLQELIKTLDRSVHKVGDVLVSSQSMRTDLAQVAKEVGRIEQKTAQTLGNWLPAFQLLDDIWNLLNSMGGADLVPAQTLTMNAACDLDSEGEPQEFAVTYPEQEKLDAILSRVNDIPSFLEQHLAWKTPICSDEKPQLEGDWVTINWISDEASPDSPLRLRKRTRYRTKSNRDSKQLQDYFCAFRWEAGPVCVRHTGAWWGDPQVWASSIGEGQRVLRHLAGEAGIDPDQVGRWAFSSSRNPRYGMTGSMGIRRIEGIPWVSRRDGSNMLPM